MSTSAREPVADSATVTRHVAPNNFDALRLLAALMVILGHGQDLEGRIPTILWNFSISRIGLDVFFCISGYLVCDSWLRAPQLGPFLFKRALRIVPALLVCVFVCALVIGPLSTALPLHRYLMHHGTWQFFLNDLFYLKLYLPGVFTARAQSGAVNGSLWSLLPEVLCYLSLPLVWLAPRLLRAVLLLAVMAACGLTGLWMFNHLTQGIGLVYSLDPKYVLVQVPFFMAAAVLRLVQTRLPTLFRLDLAVVFTASNFYLPQVLGTGSVPYEWLTLAYVVIAFGLYSTPVLNRAARFGDLSYGTYLYAFPMQQVMLDHGPHWAIVRCTMATLAVALLSWHLVEAPVLRLKRLAQRQPAPGSAAYRFQAFSSRLAARVTARHLTVLAAAAVTGLCLTLVAQSLVSVYRFHDALPFYDMITVDYRYLFGTARDFWLFQDNEHRPFVAMPLFWLDLAVFRDQEGFLVACNVVMAACIAALPWRAVARALPGRPAIAIACCALMAAASFWLANRGNLTWPKQVHMYLSVLLLMLALRRAADPRPVGSRAALGISAWLVLSTFSFSFGIVGFPAVGVVAIMRRWRPRPLLVLAGAMLGCFAAYAAVTNGLYFFRPGIPIAQLHLFQTLLFAITFLAAPAVHLGSALVPESAAVLVARCLTLASLGLFAWRALRCFVRPPTELEAWAFLLAIFSTGSAVQAALARAGAGAVHAIEYQYITAQLPFWTGLMLLCLTNLANLPESRRLLALCAAACIAFCLLVSQQAELAVLRQENAYHWQSAVSALTGVPDRALFASHIWTSPEQLIQVIDGLRSRKMFVFASPQSSWLGQPIGRFTMVSDPCPGALDAFYPVAGGDGSFVRGWSEDRRVPDWNTWIVLADATGTITGLARGGWPDPMWRRHGYANWEGYVHGNPGPVTPYLVLPDNRACRLKAGK